MSSHRKAVHYFTGAFGYFEVTHDITQFTKAVVFSEIGKKTPIAVRFSFVTGERGSADTTRYVSFFKSFLVLVEQLIVIFRLFNDAVSTAEYKAWKEVVVAYLKALYQHEPGGTEENHGYPQSV
jgi:hypothetical protein